MRFWMRWADEHWDVMALGLAFTMGLCFAAALAVGYNTSALRRGEPAATPSAVLLEDTRALLDPAL